MIDEYKAAGVSPRQGISAVVRQERRPVLDQARAGIRPQAVYLDDANTVADLPARRSRRLQADGINILAPPTFALLDLDGQRTSIVPSQAARNAKAAGLDIITWTLERSGILADGDNGFYYQTIDPAIRARAT